MSTLPETPEPQTPLPTGRRRPLERMAAALRKAIGRLAGNRLGTMLLAGAGLLMVGTVATVLVVIATRKPAEKLVTLNEALAALDGGEYAEARRLAEKLQTQGTLTTAEWGGPVFILGVVADHEARNAWDKDKPDHYLVAARYLEEARNRGFPRTREAEGLYLLGKCLSLGGQYSAARGALEAALKINPALQERATSPAGEVLFRGRQARSCQGDEGKRHFPCRSEVDACGAGRRLAGAGADTVSAESHRRVPGHLGQDPGGGKHSRPGDRVARADSLPAGPRLAGKTGATAQERRRPGGSTNWPSRPSALPKAATRSATRRPARRCT